MTTHLAPQSLLRRWQPATWQDYLAYRDAPGGVEQSSARGVGLQPGFAHRTRLFFDQDRLWIEMGEGINHAAVCDLFTLLLGFWFSQHPTIATSLGRCQMEKPLLQAVAPDLVLYLGEGVPQRQAGESRYIDLNQWRVPDLVGEISDTTLAGDLDEKKQIYAALEIPEYWVIDVRGKQVIAFRLQPDGKYQQVDESIALSGLSIALLEQTLERLGEETNIAAALWFSQQIASSMH